MCRVLIVDDEQNICKLIQNLIDWDEIGMQVVGMANDGLTAFQMMEELLPDIVISDIRMAGYDGIELIQHAREAGITASFVFVSGYRHFEYAKNAMKYGAADYILKPIKKEELTRILRHIKEQITERQQKEKQTTDLKQTLEKSRKMVDLQLLQFIENENSISEEALWDVFSLPMQNKLARFAVFRIFGEENDGSQQQRRFVLNKICDSLTQNESDTLIIKTSINSDELTYMAAYTPEHAEEIALQFSQLWVHYKAFISEYGKYQMSIGCCSQAVPADRMHAALCAAKQALAMRFTRGSEKQLELAESIPEQLSFQDVFPDGFRSVYSALIAFDQNAMQQAVSDAFDAALTYQQIIPENLFEGLDSLAHRVKEAYSNADATLIEKIKTQSRTASGYAQMKSALIRLLSQIMKSSFEGKKYQDEQPVRIAKQYIESNYTKSVTLEETAAAAGLNPNYFSVLFKKMSGKNFSEYLTDYRIDKAQKLLRTTTLNINQIADAVGYRDARYFSQLFTKNVGLKPNEYRKLYS